MLRSNPAEPQRIRTSPLGRLNPVGKVIEDAVFREEGDRKQIIDCGLEAEVRPEDVLLAVLVLRHRVYFFLGGLAPPKG